MVGLIGALGAAGGAGVNIIISAIDNFSATFSKANLALAKFGKAGLIAGAAGVAIAGGFALAVKSGIELESAMVSVQKTTGATDEEIRALRDTFIDLSKVMPISAEELANIGAVAGQLGIQGSEDIQSFTEVVAKMAIATELTAEGAALALAKISNAFGLPINEAEKLS